MKKLTLLALLLVSGQMLFAQSMGINTLTPDPSAALDIHSDHQGLLVPRVGLQSLNDNQTIVSPAHALLVYNRNENLPGGPGFYYNDGTDVSPNWKKLLDDKPVAFKAIGIQGGVQQIAYQGIIPNEGNVVKFKQETYDLSDSFGHGTSDTFKVPVKGIYQFDINLVQKTGWTIGSLLLLNRNGNYFEIGRGLTGSGGQSISVSERLEVGDEILLQIFVPQNGLNNSGMSGALLESKGSYFCGSLVTRL